MGNNKSEMSSNSQDERKSNNLIVTDIQLSIETFGLIPH